jgi:hypothetical protein
MSQGIIKGWRKANSTEIIRFSLDKQIIHRPRVVAVGNYLHFGTLQTHINNRMYAMTVHSVNIFHLRHYIFFKKTECTCSSTKTARKYMSPLFFTRKSPFQNTNAATSHVLKMWSNPISWSSTHLHYQYYQHNYSNQSKYICNLPECGWDVHVQHWVGVHPLPQNGLAVGMHNCKV